MSEEGLSGDAVDVVDDILDGADTGICNAEDLEGIPGLAYVRGAVCPEVTVDCVSPETDIFFQKYRLFT